MSNKSPAPRPVRPRGGARARRPTRRRAPTARGALLVTVAGAVVPGLGFLYSRRRVLGYAVLAGALVTAGLAFWFLPHDLSSALEFAADPRRSRIVAVGLGVALGAWVAVVVLTFLVVRPVPSPRWKLWGSAVFVGALCLVVAVPTAVAARYAVVQADLVETVFAPQRSETVPVDVSPVDPWGGRNRVNVLLLGGDGGEGRDGVRTDSMILMSVNTNSGRAVTFSLPRNMMNAPFPAGSELQALYPYGFGGIGDPGSWMLNAVYRQVPILHPDVLASSDNPGADALKLAVEGTTGLKVDYYFLVNLKGFQNLIDAMGGVTVNINTPVAVGGNTDLGIPPDDYLDPGPDQHLNGFEALWFARGRYGSDDYQRMDRQRCMVDAIVEQANPVNMLRRFGAVASAGKDMIFTDLPQDLLPAFVDLALDVKDRRVKSVVFRSSAEFNPAAPDFEWVQATVHDALTKRGSGAGGKGQNPGEDPDSVCEYQGAG